jgi:ABC-type antimicrobial peptide transport system permease subunit
VDVSLRRIRYIAFLVTLFAGVTMGLSALGIYAAVAQWLSTSQREIAVHLALGATYTHIRSSVLARIMTVTGTALLIGMAGALAARNTIQAFLYGVQPQLSTVLLFAVLLLGAVAFSSSYIPALRSKFIDPAELLRHE